MRDSVKWRKQSRIIMLLAERMNISVEEALNRFYGTNTYCLFSNANTGLELMSDEYILEDIMREISEANDN